MVRLSGKSGGEPLDVTTRFPGPVGQGSCMRGRMRASGHLDAAILLLRAFTPSGAGNVRGAAPTKPRMLRLTLIVAVWYRRRTEE